VSEVLVVGCGLLGASIGLALRGSGAAEVTLSDRRPEHEQLAVERGAGRRWDGRERAELVVVATPPGVVAGTLLELQRLEVGRTYTHVASYQSLVQHEVESLGLPQPDAVVGGHPMAGREQSGPGAAQGDLFVGRPWAVCAPPSAWPEARTAVLELARACGAVPVELSPERHDQAVALLSHLPQVAASALAAVVAGAVAEGDSLEGSLPLSLAGPGLADTTRLAGSDVALWTEILQGNAHEVEPRVRALATELLGVADALAAAAAGDPAGRAVIQGVLRRGRDGRALIPMKRGALAGAFARVRVELNDRPGELAAVLGAAAGVLVNVEDVRLEHVPGSPRGTAELLVSVDEAGELQHALAERGWIVHLST
jgi:prephenate dehydrogenase